MILTRFIYSTVYIFLSPIYYCCQGCFCQHWFICFCSKYLEKLWIDLEQFFSKCVKWKKEIQITIWRLGGGRTEVAWRRSECFSSYYSNTISHNVFIIDKNHKNILVMPLCCLLSLIFAIINIKGYNPDLLFHCHYFGTKLALSSCEILA